MGTNISELEQLSFDRNSVGTGQVSLYMIHYLRLNFQ